MQDSFSIRKLVSISSILTSFKNKIQIFSSIDKAFKKNQMFISDAKNNSSKLGIEGGLK